MGPDSFESQVYLLSIQSHSFPVLNVLQAVWAVPKLPLYSIPVSGWSGTSGCSSQYTQHDGWECLSVVAPVWKPCPHCLPCFYWIHFFVTWNNYLWRVGFIHTPQQWIEKKKAKVCQTQRDTGHKVMIKTHLKTDNLFNLFLSAFGLFSKWLQPEVN